MNPIIMLGTMLHIGMNPIATNNPIIIRYKASPGIAPSTSPTPPPNSIPVMLVISTLSYSPIPYVWSLFCIMVWFPPLNIIV